MSVRNCRREVGSCHAAACSGNSRCIRSRNAGVAVYSFEAPPIVAAGRRRAIVDHRQANHAAVTGGKSSSESGLPRDIWRRVPRRRAATSVSKSSRRLLRAAASAGPDRRWQSRHHSISSVPCCRMRRHLVYVAVTRLAADTFVHVDAVIEVNKFAQPMHAAPFERMAAAEALADGREHLAADPNLLVAIHASFGRRHAGVRRVFDRCMAVAAIDAKRADVLLVAKRHDLIADDADIGGVGRAYEERATRRRRRPA